MFLSIFSLKQKGTADTEKFLAEPNRIQKQIPFGSMSQLSMPYSMQFHYNTESIENRRENTGWENFHAPLSQFYVLCLLSGVFQVSEIEQNSQYDRSCVSYITCEICHNYIYFETMSISRNFPLNYKAQQNNTIPVT